MQGFQYWEFLGGIGLFLFAMWMLETALRGLAGRSLRRLIQHYTGSRLKAVFAGAISTAVLQSSSLISLIVLAFVAAGLMALENALGVVFGANLGTTMTGWLVATVGFKLSLNEFALPLIGVGSLVLVGGARKSLAELARVAAAIGFLLMGIEFMKSSVGSLHDAIDIEALAHYAAWQYLLFGIVFAGVVQSSSATMAVTLAALSGGIIDLSSAAAIAVGADLGTTTTVLLGAAKGAAGKKRVALAHFIFNLTTAVLAFSLRNPLLTVVAGIGIQDPLFALVAFHSLFNLLGVVLFLPVVRPFAALLEKRFGDAADREGLFVGDATATVSGAAIAAIAKETAHLIARVIRQNMQGFPARLPTPPGSLPVPFEPAHAGAMTFDDLYRQTKRLEGEILAFSVRVQSQALETDQASRLTQLLSAARHAVHSAKSLRDVRHDLIDFEDSPQHDVNRFSEHFRSVMTAFYGRVFTLRSNEQAPLLEGLSDLLRQIHEWHDHLHKEVYAGIQADRIDESEISSILNVNRELLNSNLALVMALADFHLTPDRSDALMQLPGMNPSPRRAPGPIGSPRREPAPDG